MAALRLRHHPKMESTHNYVDANSDGHLNYFEFCAAFQVVRLTWTRLNCFLTVGNGDDSSVRDGVDSQNEK